MKRGGVSSWARRSIIDGQEIEFDRRHKKLVCGRRTYRIHQGEEKSTPPKSWITTGILRALQNHNHLSVTLYKMWEDSLGKGGSETGCVGHPALATQRYSIRWVCSLVCATAQRCIKFNATLP